MKVYRLKKPVEEIQSPFIDGHGLYCSMYDQVKDIAFKLGKMAMVSNLEEIDIDEAKILLTNTEITKAHEGELCRDCGMFIAKAQLKKFSEYLEELK